MNDQNQPQQNNENQAPDQLVIHRRNALEGARWIGKSFSLFAKNPSIWIVMLVIYVGLSYMLTMIPVLMFLPTLFAPVFNAGFLSASKNVEAGQSLEIDFLFRGFKHSFRNLFQLGIITVIYNIVLIFIMSLVMEYLVNAEDLQHLVNLKSQQEIEAFLIQSPELIQGLMEAMLVALVLSIPLLLANWFAPALVMFHHKTPLAAMSLSIQACNRNMLPFLVYAVILSPLLMLSVLPLGLGLLIMLPVILISQYSSYHSIFTQTKEKGVFVV